MKPATLTTYLNFAHALPLITLLVSSSKAQTLQTVEPHTPPLHHQETYTYPDGSTATVWVVKTIPGVRYTFQTSQDLQTWTEIDNVYGMGHEIVIPMVYRQAPVPSSTPPAPVVKKLLTPFLMRPCTAGGIVLTWKSLDATADSNYSSLPFRTVHLPNLTLAPEWSQQIMYSQAFGKFYFLVNHPTISQAPPYANSELPENSLDAEFLESFESALPQMNAEVIASTAAIRNAPETPPATSERKFWRAIADWGIDTDSDGSADWAEFRMQLENTGGANNAPLADPTSADSNNDGIVDGLQLNSDQDSIPDALDASPHDPLINWKRTLPTRFALFSLPPAVDSLGLSYLPINVNAKGMVLYRDGTYYNNQYHELPKNSEHVGVRAKYINDEGRILGGASYAMGNDGVGGSRSLYWFTPTTFPIVVGTEDFAPIGPFSTGIMVDLPGQHLANDGTFIGLTYENTTDEHGNPTQTMRGSKVWQVDSNGDINLLGDAGAYDYSQSETTLWGTNDSGTMQVLFDGMQRNIGTTNHTNLTLVGTENQAVLHGGTSSARFFKDGMWSSSSTFGRIDGISDTGLALSSKGIKSNNGYGSNSPEFWYNDQFYSLERMVPEAPAAFTNQQSSYNLGMSNKGHTLLGTLNNANEQQDMALAFPCAAIDDEPYTGLDDFSITSSATDPAYADKIWIMVPTGGGAANSVKMQIPASTENPITISAPGLTGTITITEPNQTVAFMGNRATSGDEDLIIKSGSATSLSKPIGLKYMKRRVVKIALHPVATNDSFPGTLDVPDLVPTQQELSLYLNEVYSKQINAQMDVVVKPQVTLNFSTSSGMQLTPVNLSQDGSRPIPTMGDAYLDYFTGSGPGEQHAFASLKDPNVDINVYMFAGYGIKAWLLSSTHGWLHFNAVGIADPATNQCWVDGDNVGAEFFGYGDTNSQKRHALHTIAHEIGHIVMGAGHPDQKSGPAILPGSEHIQRLMVAGGKSGLNIQHRIVKGEWDAAERWLTENIDLKQATGN